MTDIKRVSRKELTATEILEHVETGGRVVIELSMLGQTMTLVIRHHSGTYYCDTPVKLLKHETRTDLRECLETFNLVKEEPAQETELHESDTELPTTEPESPHLRA